MSTSSTTLTQELGLTSFFFNLGQPLAISAGPPDSMDKTNNCIIINPTQSSSQNVGSACLFQTVSTFVSVTFNIRETLVHFDSIPAGNKTRYF